MRVADQARLAAIAGGVVGGVAAAILFAVLALAFVIRQRTGQWPGLRRLPHQDPEDAARLGSVGQSGTPCSILAEHVLSPATSHCDGDQFSVSHLGPLGKLLACPWSSQLMGHLASCWQLAQHGLHVPCR